MRRSPPASSALFAAGSFAPDELRALAARAYGGFAHAAVAPLVQLDERIWLLELFHGPTLAFKDLALQLVGLMFDSVLARRGEHVTIVGATSGDTGSAAMAACRDRDALDIFILYPHGRVSDVQRRQMTTSARRTRTPWQSRGISTTARISSRRCSPMPRLRRELNLSAVNSINFARVAAQIVYYITAGVALGAPARPVSFSVPTGNFGNVYAGHLARALGLPIERLIVGTNANDVLARYLNSGEMTIAPVMPSLSPSMDIQVASNFERLLFELKGRSGAAVTAAMRQFRDTGALPADEQAWRAARALFSGHRADDAATLDTIADTYRRTGMLIDPHTAVAVAAARAEAAEADAGDADDRACDRPPGEISRRRRAGYRHPPENAGSAGGNHGKAGAVDGSAERCRCGRALCPRSRAPGRAGDALSRGVT